MTIYEYKELSIDEDPFFDRYFRSPLIFYLVASFSLSITVNENIPMLQTWQYEILLAATILESFFNENRSRLLESGEKLHSDKNEYSRKKKNSLTTNVPFIYLTISSEISRIVPQVNNKLRSVFIVNCYSKFMVLNLWFDKISIHRTLNRSLNHESFII